MATSKQFNAEQGVSVGQGLAVVDSTGNLTTQTITGRNTNTDIQITPNGTGSVIVPSVNKVAITQPASTATLTIASGKTLTVNETFTMTALAGSTIDFGSGGTIVFEGGGFIYDNVAALTSLASVGTITTGVWGATPVGTAYGGTGANLSNPGADRIFFWDASANAGSGGSAWLQLGNSLAITGTSFDTIQDIRTTATPTFAGLTVNGNFTVTGTSTILNTSELSVDDINITLGDTASPTDASATGGGITLRGTTNKTIIWDNINANWTSSEHFNIPTGKQYKINNVQIAASNLSNGTTGTGSIVLASTPTLTTPVLGVATATTINKVTITAPATSATLTIANGKTLTVNNTLTFTGTDASSVAFGAGGTVAYVANKLNVFAATTSAELAGVISDETGSGALVFASSPVLVSPTLGTASATAITISGTNAATPLSVSNTNDSNVASIYGINSSPTLTGGASTTRIYGLSNQVVYTPAAASIIDVYHDLNTILLNNGTSYTNIYASFARMDFNGAAIGGTVTKYVGYYIPGPIINAAATKNITSYYGLQVENPVQGTSQTISNVYGVSSEVVSGANRWNIYASGTAQNYFGGAVGFGMTPFQKISIGNSAGSGLHLSNSTTDTGGYLNSVGTAELLTSAGATYNSYSAPNYVMTAKSTSASGVQIVSDINFWSNTGLVAGNTFNPVVRMKIASSGTVSISGLTTNGPMVTTGGTGAISNISIAGQAGKYLYTDGSTTSWNALAIPAGLTTGSASVGFINYNGTTKTQGQWYGGTTAPTNVDRLNFDGYIYATKFFGDVSGATGAGATISDSVGSTMYLVGATTTTGAMTTAYMDSVDLTYNGATSTLYCTNVSTSSDEKLKENIVTIADATTTISSLRGVGFNWKKDGEKSYGVIAQELEQILPELVSEKEDGTKSVKYIALIGFLIESIKEMDGRIRDLESR